MNKKDRMNVCKAVASKSLLCMFWFLTYFTKQLKIIYQSFTESNPVKCEIFLTALKDEEKELIIVWSMIGEVMRYQLST